MFVVILNEKNTSGVYVAFEKGIPDGFSEYDFFEVPEYPSDCSFDCGNFCLSP